MRKYIILALGLLMAMSAFSQSVQTWTEDFDGTVSFTATPTNSWVVNTNYYAPNSTSANPKSYLGLVPTYPGNTTILETPIYDCTNYEFIVFKFSHICKVSPKDIARIEYRINKGAAMGNWDSIPAELYMGTSLNYRNSNFNAASYPEWQADDSTVFPTQSWWKEEVFDMGGVTAGRALLQFRFIIKHGQQQGTQLSYGWLIDNVEISAASYDLFPPQVAFRDYYPKDSTITTGPFTLNALVKTSTNAPIQNPWLVYTSTLNDISVTDSTLMTHVAGDSLWRATLPQFPAGTSVTYSITGRDLLDNYTIVMSSYHVGLGDMGNYLHSAGLTSINSPIRGQTTGGVSTPVTITLQNKGDSALKNINICWSANGGATNTYVWTGNLLWDYSDVVTIGNYMPKLEQYDTLKIWVSMPNGISDSANYDDTLSITTYGCLPGGMTGIYTVGQTGDFQTIRDALNALELCTPLGGDVTFEMESGIYTEGISLTNFVSILGNNTLTITSATHTAEDVIIRPVTGVGITLSNNKNIIIKEITIDATKATPLTYAVHFTGSCNNITIRDCRLLADTLTTSLTANPIYLNNVGVFDGISIIHNLIEGGYYGIYLYGGSRLSTNFIIDSNTFQSQYTLPMLIESFFHCTSISYNTILSRTVTPSTTWYGIFVNASYVENIIGNRIRQRSIAITNPYGIAFQYQQNCPIKGISTIADNEIIISTSNAYHGIYMDNGSQANIVHNSIYVGGSGAGRGIHIADAATNLLTIKNNNIIMQSSTAHPIYLNGISNLRLYDIDYNNIYAPQYVGYAGGNIVTIAAWQQIISTDKHSISIRPEFVDSTSHLQLLDYSKLKCLKVPGSLFDIDYRFRISEGDTTTMGCYHGLSPLPVNAALMKLIGNHEGVVLGNTDNIVVTLLNMGSNSITQATIKWEVNGVSQGDILWTGSLSTEDEINIPLGTITYSSTGIYRIKAWIDNLSGLTDEYPSNDTIMVSGSVCSSPINGIYVLGNNSADFLSIKEFSDYLLLCGAAGDITLQIQPGTYQGSLNLNLVSRTLDGYNFNMTSTTAKAEDVIIKTNGVGITLGQNRNIRITHITIDATAGSCAIQFTDACTNIVVRDCRLLANPTTKTLATAPVYKASGTGVTDSIFFIHNEIDGGYYGIYFYAGTGNSANQYGTNTVFDSNTITNAYSQSILSYCNTFTSCSYNTISSRLVITTATWYGIYTNYTNGTMVGNRIIQRSNAITNPYGIYFQFYNYYPAGQVQGRGLIANNEMILNTTGAYYGISAGTYSKVEMIHNSIYISGSGAARGIYINNNTYNDMVIKNNNIAVTSPSAHPVYFSAIGNLNLYDIDYNNYSSPDFIGYYGGNITTLTNWKQLFVTDQHSVRVTPTYVNLSENLQLMNYDGLLCNRISTVIRDKEGNPRALLTTVGCYEGLTLQNVNAMLVEITGTREGMVLSQTDTVKVEIYNTGYTALSSVNIEWSINDVTQNTGGTNYPISLTSRGQSATIFLGPITYSTINMDIKVWINSINSGANTDEYVHDDTVNKSIYICTGKLSGLITIGTSAGSDFKTIKQFSNALTLCGVSGDLNVVLESGIYNENLDLSNNATLMSNYASTITSSTGKANDVIIRPPANWGVLLSNSKNIVLKALTIDAATNGTNAIEFTGACSNIVIRDCRLLADTTTTESTFNPVYKTAGTGLVDNISFIHNLLDGGCHGFYFYGGTSNTAFGTNVIFDSNTVSNQYTYGTYPYYTDFVSCSYNTILSRTANTNVTWYGIMMFYSNGPAIGNRIMQRSDAITQPYGIVSQYHNYYPVGMVQDRGLIANNEIILNMNYGIYAIYSKSEILHNSIYISGHGAARGIYILNVPNNDIVIKNNSIVMEDMPMYPVYFSAVGNLNLYDIDYNNMYAPQYVGYYGGNKLTLTDWQSSITTDLHSVIVLPPFINPVISLELSNYSNTMSCPVAEIRTDINGLIRDNITIMGAYIDVPQGCDLMLSAISPWNNEAINNQTISVNVDILNAAATPITSAILGWSVNDVTKTPVSWTATPALNLLESRSIPMGTFQITNADTFNIKVWIETVNNQPDPINWNDSLSAQSILFPIVEFVSPKEDTLFTLSFDVKAKIRTFTGAPVIPPVLYVETIVKDAYIFHDSITMVQNDDLWQANIPQQYYDSKVIYSLTISDLIGNTLLLKDSVYIALNLGISDIYQGNNLGLLSFLSPVTDMSNLCASDYSPVRITMINSGENDYDFSKDSVTLKLEVLYPQQPTYMISLPINSGIFKSQTIDTIELESSLPIMYAGKYELKAWVESPVDNIFYDDTIYYTYTSGKIGLPIDEDFSNGILSTDFITASVVGSDVWTPNNNPTLPIQAIHGTGILQYTGTQGTMTELTTRQLDLTGSVNAKLEFWYYHDATASDLDNSYTEVNIVKDGVLNLALSLSRKGITHGWKQYTIPLNQYTNAQCILVQFVSMNKFGAQSPQYIDRILITSEPELAVSEIFISPEITACNLKNKELKVVLTTNTNQIMDFSNDTTSLVVEVIGLSTFVISLQDAIAGNSSDTIFIASNINFSKGLHNVRAYLRIPVDNYAANDTITRVVDIRPALSVSINPVTNANACVKKESEVGQEIILRNTGNMDIPEMELLLLIDVTPQQIIRESISTPLQAGDSIRYTFNNMYTVPAEVDYPVRVLVWMKCDSALVNNLSEIQECVDLHNISIASLDNPPMDRIDVAGSTENIIVTLKNESYLRRYPNVSVTAMIEDENGQMLNSRISILSNIEPLDSALLTFTEPYTVPNDSVYYIKVFLNSLDIYPEDDTLTIKRYTETVGISAIGGNNGFTLGQNIPNPAGNSTTRIDYSVPASGEVIFHVQSASGQLLYSKTIEAASGINSLEFNTHTLAAGIYIYSIEYKGQRLIKRMSVQK